MNDSLHSVIWERRRVHTRYCPQKCHTWCTYNICTKLPVSVVVVTRSPFRLQSCAKNVCVKITPIITPFIVFFNSIMSMLLYQLLKNRESTDFVVLTYILLLFCVRESYISVFFCIFSLLSWSFVWTNLLEPVHASLYSEATFVAAQIFVCFPLYKSTCLDLPCKSCYFFICIWFATLILKHYLIFRY